MPPPKRGRPPLADPRNVIVPIRVTADEHDRLADAATAAGLGLGPWLRSLGLREAGESGAPSPRPSRSTDARRPPRSA